MRVVICGPYLTEEMEMLLPDSSPAAGKFLRNLKHGFERYGVEVEVVSYQSIQIPEENSKELLEEIAQQKECYVFKGGSTLRSIKRYRNKILNVVKPGDYVIIYNAVYPTMFLQCGIRQRGAKPILIMADYTEPEEYTSLPRKVVAYLAKIDMRMYEKYIVLSKMYLTSLKIEKQKLLIQGGIDDSIIDSFPKPEFNDDKILFYYSGYLSAEVGIRNLLNAMELLDTDRIELVISGRGPLEGDVQQRATQDKRVRYIGYVTNEQYYEQLKEAHVLVNPRDMTLKQNRNNFPSKIMEYIASSRIILSTKFSGWEDFTQNVMFAESSSSSLAERMNQLILNYGSQYETVYQINFKKAHEFAWSNQAKRIIDFLQ